MAQIIDYTPLDLPEANWQMFHPQRVWSNPPAGGSDHLILVEEGVSLSARFHPYNQGGPTILFFHGNGEVACQFDGPARYYGQAGANLFVADFRGYGLSSGVSSFSNMISDARVVFEYCRDFLTDYSFSGPLFVKGRSLGCHSAVEVATHFQSELSGLILESGSAAVARMARRWGLSLDTPQIAELVRLHEEKLRSIALPLLTICGERDELISTEAVVELYESIGSEDKTLEVIPGAGHNDLWLVGRDQYFESVRKFISEHGG